MSDTTHAAGATDQRHIRIGRAAWRAAAARAAADCRPLAELVTALADAYGAGAVALPPADPGTDPTTVRHARIGRAAWRAAAAAARRDGTGPADAVARLVRAYGAGELEAPAPADGTNRTDVRPRSADRTGVRPLPRESNGCSTAPSAGPARASSPTTTQPTTTNATPTQDHA